MGVLSPFVDLTPIYRCIMRYSICYTPPPASPLWQQGSRWLGWDALSGRHLPQPRFRNLTSDHLAELTRIPARYGFHAAFVPPFRLNARWAREDLFTAMAAFCLGQRPFFLPSLIINQFDNYLCLRPTCHSASLQVLASLCTREFDRFRTPLSPSELARCKAARLSGQEKKNLEIWGYPYVFEQYLFHFTLTGRMVQNRRTDTVLAALFETFRPLLDKPLLIDALCLFVEPELGMPMRCVERFPFSPHSSEPEEQCNYAQVDREQKFLSWIPM